MDQRELDLQHLGICYRLYHFIVKALASQAMKTVTLGPPQHYDLSSSKVQICKTSQRGFGTKEDKLVCPQTPCEVHFGDSISPSTEHSGEKNNPCRNNMLISVPQAPKKTVSINENVEEIILLSAKGSNSFQKSNSFDQDEHPKPLRSILKIASNDKSNSIC